MIHTFLKGFLTCIAALVFITIVVAPALALGYFGATLMVALVANIIWVAVLCGVAECLDEKFSVSAIKITISDRTR